MADVSKDMCMVPFVVFAAVTTTTSVHGIHFVMHGIIGRYNKTISDSEHKKEKSLHAFLGSLSLSLSPVYCTCGHFLFWFRTSPKEEET